LEIIDDNPLNCVLKGANRIGRVKLVLSRIPSAANPSTKVSELPQDFKFHISETYQVPSEKQHTWSFGKVRTRTLEQPKQLNDVTRAPGKKSNGFEMIYFKFESSVSCKFRMEVTFPEEDAV